MTTFRYKLNDDVSFHLKSGAIEIVRSHQPRRDSLPLDLWPLLPELCEPLTVAELAERCDTGLTLAELDGLFIALVEREVLRIAAEPVRTPSLATLLRPDLFGNRGFAGEISDALRAGRMVVIPDALPSDLAGRAHDALEASPEWKAYEGHYDGFSFSHHNLFEQALHPAGLREACAVFEHPESCAFMEQLAGVPCSTSVSLGASWYRPGDYSLPHTDHALERTVAFVWHLTKGWKPSWGGQLVWCPAGKALEPRFNWLTIFLVDHKSLHFVAPVSSHAVGKRFAINGWWRRPEGQTGPQPPARVSDPDVITLGDYGAASIAIGPGGAVRAV